MGKDNGSSRGFGKGRSPTKFSFTYEDYAGIFGCSAAAVRKHAQRGNFDPNDLVSILEFIQRRLKGDASLSDLVAEARKAAADEVVEG